MQISASEFKAKCLALIDRVHERGEAVLITKRGRPVARLVPAGEEERPWLRVRGTAQWRGDPLAPALDEHEIEALDPELIVLTARGGRSARLQPRRGPARLTTQLSAGVK